MTLPEICRICKASRFLMECELRHCADANEQFKNMCVELTEEIKITTKQEIQEQANRLQEELDKLNKKINEMPDDAFVRWRAEQEKDYFTIDADGDIVRHSEVRDNIDNFSYNIGNYFKTEQEAIDYKDNLITKQKLKDLALRLNNGVKIDWTDTQQRKYYIAFNAVEINIFSSTAFTIATGSIYCLDKNFLDIALQEIGEEALMKLIKSGV